MSTRGTGVGAARRGLLVDWGGVMTSSLFSSFSEICAAEGLRVRALREVFRDSPEAGGLLAKFEEGRISEPEFEAQLGSLIGLAAAEGLIERIFMGVAVDEQMVEAVRRARRAGIATGLISNSLGTSRYPRELLEELFDGIVISGEVGIRKPDPRIYELGAQSIAREPRECVFVDDLAFNLEPARALGMEVIHHRSAASTIAELEELLGIALREPAPGATEPVAEARQPAPGATRRS